MNETAHPLDLSIVIPVGPDDEAWRALLPLLTGLPNASEIVISATNNAPPDWAETASSAPIDQSQWRVSEPGRALQLNHAIERSRGRMLWLLHADSRPDQQATDAVTRQIHRQEDCWFYFDLVFDTRLKRITALNAVGANLRSAMFSLPFGDQGWLMSRTVFERVGPFDITWPRGEDLEWALRAKRHRIRPLRMGEKLMTSSRRYIEHGWLRTTLDHQMQMWRMIRAARRQHRDLT